MMNRVRLADGRTGTVMCHTAREVDVQIDGGRYEAALPISEVTEIEAEPQFKIGDKVEFTLEIGTVMVQRFGKIAAIDDSYAGRGRIDYRITYRGGSFWRTNEEIAAAGLTPNRGQLNSAGNRSDGR